MTTNNPAQGESLLFPIYLLIYSLFILEGERAGGGKE